MATARVEVFTSQLDQCYNILTQQMVIINTMKEMLDDFPSGTYDYNISFTASELTGNFSVTSLEALSVGVMTATTYTANFGNLEYGCTATDSDGNIYTSVAISTNGVYAFYGDNGEHKNINASDMSCVVTKAN